MNNLRKNIKESYHDLTDTNKLISDVILNNKTSDFNLNITQLAQKSYCSNSAIIKYIKYFGYSSYKVFKADLNSASQDNFTSYINSLKLVEDYFNDNPEVIEDFIAQLENSNKVYLFAAGQSQISAIDFALKSNKLATDKYIFEANMITQKLLISTISSNDSIIFISNSGEARELISFCSMIKNDNKILITNRHNSKLSKKIDKIICLNNTFEPPRTFKNYSCESKYTLLYFFDKIFETLYGHLI